MPVSLNPTTSTRPQSRPLRFGAGASTPKVFPSELLPSVLSVNVFQKKVIGFQKGDESELNFLVNNWATYDAHMAELQDSIKNKATYDQKTQENLALLEKQHQLVLQKYPDVLGQVFDGIKDSVQLGATANAAGGSKAKATASASDGDNAASKDAKPLQSAAANWTPRDERTRFKVLMDLGKQYITRGPLLSDTLWSTGIGAVLAIGSPVMAVTIPTTFAFFLAGRTALALMHFCQDPRGDSINAKYEKWIEKDAEKLKKQEANQASD